MNREMHKLFGRLKPALESKGLDPRVTLAALAHPGLLSVVASRLVVANFQLECMLTSLPRFPLAQPNKSLDARAGA
jgi:hypothetical protein